MLIAEKPLVHAAKTGRLRIEPFRLFRYMDEQTFRYNNRKALDDQGRFEMAMGNVAGKRLTYRELIGETGAATSH